MSASTNNACATTAHGSSCPYAGKMLGLRLNRTASPSAINRLVAFSSAVSRSSGALGVMTPGADGPEEVLTPTPTFEWEDDSSEDGYEIRVFDAFGNEIWSDEIGPVSGSTTVTDTYAGPALETGLFYQFRAMSFRDKTGGRTAISSTEDLTGVFQFVGTE